MLAFVNKKSVVLATPGMALLLYMRNKVAKRLRKEAKKETIGKSESTTRAVYNEKKKQYKAK
jgi:hypothetical protein